jgi:HSP20 family protein
MQQGYEYKANEEAKNSQEHFKHKMPQSKPLKNAEKRTPRVDIYEAENTYFVRISLPGVKKDDLYIRFSSENNLEIKGMVRPEIPEEFSEIVMKEIYEGPFRGIIQFPKKVDSNHVRFDYQGGILAIYITKF